MVQLSFSWEPLVHSSVPDQMLIWGAWGQSTLPKRELVAAGLGLSFSFYPTEDVVRAHMS